MQAPLFFSRRDSDAKRSSLSRAESDSINFDGGVRLRDKVDVVGRLQVV